MRTVFSYALKYKWIIIIGLLLMFVELAVELIQPLFIRGVIDDGITVSNLNNVWMYLGLMLAASIISTIAGVFNTYLSSYATNAFGNDLRNAIFRRVQHFTLETLSKFNGSTLITRLTQDVLISEMLVFFGMRILLRAPLLVIGSLVMSFVVNVKLGFYLTLLTPILFVFLFVTATIGAKIFSRIQKRLDKINRFFQENLSGMLLIKVNNRAEYESERFSNIAGKLRDDMIFGLRLMESILPVLLLIMNGSLLLVLYISSDLIQTNNVQVGEVVAVINYALRMQGGFSMFSFLIISATRAKASADRISEVLHEDVDELDDGRKIEHTEGSSVEFQNVSFKYVNSVSNILEDVSFKVDKNETLVIMGATGSGKSSLVNLIPRLYDATKGNVYVDGKNVKDWNVNELRDLIGYVPQSAVLFTGTIFENMLWGDEYASLNDVYDSTRKAQVHENIIRFDHQYNTQVGQRGVQLSGGQKQRLSIARALVKRPSILILDDSTSALDATTENSLWEEMDNLNVTRVIITQKISTAKTADKILLLEEGKVSAIGTHDSLLLESELYQSIVESQKTGGSFDD
ncbi:ABC transporter ATP-binding protein [Nosocomiicoccus ampullae]|uniref:ATP-binding cassette subfamily B protein n=1 Tax=Nosocomiicoccus ampullae TaxID=489910 RepID=A0A9Q2CZT1_9STAP|nr:ABC transporter ATP-binding protein [Nosocomiicoccus ampullae]MBB5176283.1 ATP-binding cassette subfamily B protein [Nosocomiicoccus ampullae]QYA47444.1 ABC transporter ATP-binding protein/permease [Nosocomiicoccus ampullae]